MGADSDKLRELAAFHRVQPLLDARLGEHASGTEMRARVAHNLRLTAELIRLTKAFASAEIPVLPHKGPLLADAAYGDLALREFTDLDLLIHASDLPRAITVLAEHGYHAPDELAWLSPTALLRWSPEMTYRSGRGVAVDLHWRLTPSHYTVQLDPEILWRSRTSITLAGSQIPTIAPEALLLLLAVHGAKHAWECLGWLADIAWLLNANQKLRWQGVMALAPNFGCQRAVALAESLVDAVFHSQPPSDPLCKRVLDRWYHGPLESPRSPELFSFACALAPRPTASARHLFGVIFAPTEIDWRGHRLPESLFWLYAAGRTWRLLRKYCDPSPFTSEQ
jgi:hypothetical protein